MLTLLRLFSKNNKTKRLNIWLYIVTYSFNLFSVIFASQIALELKNTLPSQMLVFLFVGFTCFFLLVNEGIKIIQCQKDKPNIFILLFTFTLSLSLSGLGIFFMSNKTIENDINVSSNKSIGITNLTRNYTLKIDSIQNLDYNNTNEYKNYIQQINQNNSRPITKNYSIAKQKANEAKIYALINKGNESFNTIKNNKINEFKQLQKAELSNINNNFTNINKSNKKKDFVSYIFVALVLISEFISFFLNTLIGKKERELIEYTTNDNFNDYLVARNMLKYLFATNSENKEINIKVIQFSLFAKVNSLYNENDSKLLDYDFNKTKVKKMFDNFININIITKVETNDNTEKYYKFIADEKTTLKNFDKIYKIILD